MPSLIHCEGRIVNSSFSHALFVALTIASATALGAQSASAADLTRPVYKAPAAAPLYNWSGFYAGVNVGWGWNDSSADRTAFSSALGAAVAVGQVPASIGFTRDGVLGGGQIGYNWQAGAFVLGLETDFQGSNIRGAGSVFYPGPGSPVLITANSRLDWFGTVRGRLGFTPLPEALLYVTGGLAYGHVNNNASWVADPLTSGNLNGSSSDTRAGWTVGAGAEWAFAPRWSVKAEYLYVDLGNTTVRETDPQYPVDFLDYKFEHRDHIVRVGLNYKFGG